MSRGVETEIQTSEILVSFQISYLGWHDDIVAGLIAGQDPFL